MIHSLEELEITEKLYKRGMSSEEILMYAINLRIQCDREIIECHKEWEKLNNRAKKLRKQQTSKLVKKL